jgi:hypothetical protein
METERAYLVKVGQCWIDLHRITFIAPPPAEGSPLQVYRVTLTNGMQVEMPEADFRQLMDKLQSFGLLAG